MGYVDNLEAICINVKFIKEEPKMAFINSVRRVELMNPKVECSTYKGSFT